jgi:hypothetical protein
LAEEEFNATSLDEQTAQSNRNMNRQDAKNFQLAFLAALRLGGSLF